MHIIFHYLAMWTGLSDINGSWYAWWSGIGSDLGELALVGTILHHLRSTKKQRNQQADQLHNQISQIVKLTDKEGV